jgi:hypothetical protein
VLVLAERQGQPVLTPVVRALTDEFVLIVDAPETQRLLQDGLVDGPEQNFVLRKAFFAGIVAAVRMPFDDAMLALNSRPR